MSEQKTPKKVRFFDEVVSERIELKQLQARQQELSQQIFLNGEAQVRIIGFLQDCKEITRKDPEFEKNNPQTVKLVQCQKIALDTLIWLKPILLQNLAALEGEIANAKQKVSSLDRVNNSTNVPHPRLGFAR